MKAATVGVVGSLLKQNVIGEVRHNDAAVRWKACIRSDRPGQIGVTGIRATFYDQSARADGNLAIAKSNLGSPVIVGVKQCTAVEVDRWLVVVVDISLRYSREEVSYIAQTIKKLEEE